MKFALITIVIFGFYQKTFSQNGNLLVIGPSDWRVYIDNDFKGFTVERGLFLKELNAGRHTVSLRNTDNNLTDEFQILSDKTAEIEIVEEVSNKKVFENILRTDGYYLSTSYVAIVRSPNIRDFKKYYVVAFEVKKNQNVRFALWYDVKKDAKSTTFGDLKSAFNETKVKSAIVANHAEKGLQASGFLSLSGERKISLSVLGSPDQLFEFTLRGIFGTENRITVNDIHSSVIWSHRKNGKLVHDVISSGDAEKVDFDFYGWTDSNNSNIQYRLKIEDGSKSDDISIRRNLVNDLVVPMEKISYKISSMVDARDNKEYKTVAVGKQTWMAENLNYEMSNSDVSTQKDSYGSRYYKWELAMKACPVDWHLPSIKEFQELIDVLGGNESAGIKLKSKIGWIEGGEGNNESGFNAKGIGSWRSSKAGAVWWSSTQNGIERAWELRLSSSNTLTTPASTFKPAGQTVRCIKD